MTLLVPAMAVTFAAFCVWLTVRIVNRRERWAKRTALAVVVLLGYPLSFGPACWFCSRLGIWADTIPAIYRPIVSTLNVDDYPSVLKNLTDWQSHGDVGGSGWNYPVPAARNSLFSRYASLGAGDGWYWYCVFRFGPDREIIEEWMFIPPNTRQ